MISGGYKAFDSFLTTAFQFTTNEPQSYVLGGRNHPLHINSWLKEVDKFALTNAIYNMDSAYQKFFREHAGYPKFKSKDDNYKSSQTNFTNGNITVDFDGNKVKLPKLKGVKAKLHRKFSGQIKSATISQVPSGKYYVSVLVETERMELPHANQKTGIDLGIKDLCITSDGKRYENPKIIRKYEMKLIKLQRQLAHKEKRSQNYHKTKKKIALCHEKITNTRKDYLHKMSNEIISENQVIVSENLQIKNMVKNHHLAKSISDVSWYELTRQLEYKAKWNGREYIKIDTFYASSRVVFHLRIPKYRDEKSVSKGIGMSCLWYKA